MAQKPWTSAFCSRFFLLLFAIAMWWLLFVVDFASHQQVPATSAKPSTSSSVRATSVRRATSSPRKASRPLLGYLSRGSQNLSSAEPRHRHSPNPRSDTVQPFWRALAAIANRSDPCAGRYVFAHDLPSEFNQDLLDNCHQLSPWTNMCKYTENAGLGPRLEDETLTGSAGASEAWFATNQFAVDVIFHNRMKQYECLTTDPEMANAFYVPYYAGLDIARHLWGANVTVRDILPLKLASWLRERPEWRITAGGRDHFLVGGRITWDFRRLTDSDSDWGNKLLYISEIMNMSMLTVEASPYHSNDFAIPYPTYFHPSKDAEVWAWQSRVRALNRTALFSFAGAPRPELSTSIRGQIMDQCRESKHCKLLECDRGLSKCHVPSVVMNLFEESVFCLQPQGDSYTRRSIFDSMIAGCIPVFFHEHSAYTQYVWHLPKDRTKYSVFIPEDDVRTGKVSIEQILLRYSQAEIEAMRAEVIRLIPGLVYNDPRHGRLMEFKDAFDLTVQGVIERVTDIRVRIMQGRDNFMESGVASADDIRNNDLKLSQRDIVRQWEGDRRNGEQETQSSL